jgi:hypothetical protein
MPHMMFSIGVSEPFFVFLCDTTYGDDATSGVETSAVVTLLGVTLAGSLAWIVPFRFSLLN